MNVPICPEWKGDLEVTRKMTLSRRTKDRTANDFAGGRVSESDDSEMSFGFSAMAGEDDTKALLNRGPSRSGDPFDPAYKNKNLCI